MKDLSLSRPYRKYHIEEFYIFFIGKKSLSCIYKTQNSSKD